MKPCRVIAPSYLSGFVNFLRQVNSVQTLRLGMERLTGWAPGPRTEFVESPPSGVQLVRDSQRLIQIISGGISQRLDSERRSLRVRIYFLEQARALLEPLHGAGTATSASAFEEARQHLGIAAELLKRMHFEEVAIKVQTAITHAEQSLALGHVENLFSDPDLMRLVFACDFGRPDEHLKRKEDVLAKIEGSGLDGYLEFLVSILNQHWAPVVSLESLRGRFAQGIDEEMLEEHQGSVVLILGLLSAIERDSHIGMRFRDRWREFSPSHTLEEVRSTAESALYRKKDEG